MCRAVINSTKPFGVTELFIHVCMCPPCLCAISWVGVYVEAEGKYQYFKGLFFSRLLSLLFYPHYTPISLEWIKPAIKSSIHVSVKDTRHINTNTQWTLFYPNADFTASVFVPSPLFVCMSLDLRICVFFKSVDCEYVQRSEIASGKGKHALVTAPSEAQKMIRNVFYWHCKCILHRLQAVKG